jgi:N-acetylated-alpha-linked acidic dipeptidase
VTDPQKKISVEERSRAQSVLDGSADERREARERTDLRIGALGSGSDFTPFLQHLGVASLNLGFGGEDGGGSYHSIYDSFDHYTRFGDPGFDYGIALAQVAGRIILRFADADTLPLSFGNFTDTVANYVREVTKLADDTRDEIAERNRRIKEGTYSAVFDPTQIYVMPKAETSAPYLNFAPLQNALARLQESTRMYQSVSAGMAAQEHLRSRETQVRLDQILMRVEHSMTNEAGLPRRPWFKHQIYAPGFYTGYGVKTLPAVREAIEQHNWKEAGEQIGVVAHAIEQIASEIDRAAALLQEGK